VVKRTRTTSRRRDVPTERREITDSSRELLHQRRTFAQRERQRLGLSPVTPIAERKAPTLAGAVKAWLSKGYSLETAQALAEQIPTPFWRGGEQI
jgi:hypothetical protein